MVKRIMAELGDECEVNVDVLHETLLKLPAEKYIELYKKMYAKIYRYPLDICAQNTNLCQNIETKENE